MFRNTQQTQSNESKPLLTWRLINSLPLVPSIKSLYPSAKELYLNTKISNPLLSAGLDYAEGSIAAASAPLISRYEKMDSFASSKLEELEQAYEEGLPTLAKKGALQGVRAVAYPVGFTLEMAHQARGKAIELATPAISRAYNVANGMVDVLIPGEPNEDVYDRISGQTRSPIRRLRRRMNARALAQLPINAFYFSLGASSVFTYEALLIGRTMQDYLWSQLDRSLYVLAGLEAFLIAQPISVLGHNLRHASRIAAENTEFVVQALLTNALARSEALQSKLEDSKLPKTAHLVHRLSDDLQNLSAFFGIHVGDSEHPLMVEASSSSPNTPIDTPPRSRRALPGKRTRVQELSRRHVNPYIAQRMPTFFSGNDALARTEQIDNERTSGIMTGEGVTVEPATTIEASYMDSDAYNSSLPSSGNVSEIDESEDFRRTPRYLTVKHAGALTSAFLRGLRGGYKTTPPTPANSPVPHHGATKNMPMIVITQEAPASVADITEDEHVVTELLEEKLDGKHATFHMPAVTVKKPKSKLVADSNPFDVLANAPDMTEETGEETSVTRHHHHHSHNHNHGHHGYTSKHAARVAHRAQVHAHHVADESEAPASESIIELVVPVPEVVVEEPKMTEEEVHAVDHHVTPVEKKHTAVHHTANKPVDSNPFDVLADAADPMGSPLNERVTLDSTGRHHHHSHNHNHSHHGFTSKHQAKVHARQAHHEAAVHDEVPVEEVEEEVEEVVLSVPEDLEVKVEAPVSEINENHAGEEEEHKKRHHHRAAHPHPHHEKPTSENPFDALADAPDPMGSPLMTKKVHHHSHNHHLAGQASI